MGRCAPCVVRATGPCTRTTLVTQNANNVPRLITSDKGSEAGRGRTGDMLCGPMVRIVQKTNSRTLLNHHACLSENSDVWFCRGLANTTACVPMNVTGFGETTTCHDVRNAGTIQHSIPADICQSLRDDIFASKGFSSMCNKYTSCVTETTNVCHVPVRWISWGHIP